MLGSRPVLVSFAFIILLFGMIAQSAAGQSAHAQDPLPPSALIMAIDCAAQTVGLQYYCSPAPDDEYEAPIVLQNITGLAVQFASFRFEVGAIDALSPQAAPADTLDSNPDFNDADLGRQWACTTSLDINPEPSLLRTFISCSSTAGAATLAAGSSIELARVRYDVADQKDAPVFLEHVTVNDAAGRDVGSCYPEANQPRQREMLCYDAIPFFDRAFGESSITLRQVTGLAGGAVPFAVDVVQSADVATKIIQVDLHFDRDILALVDLVPADAYYAALSVSGVAGQSKEEAIREANRTGTLRNATLAHDAREVPPGEHIAFRAVFAALRTGVSPVLISGQELLDSEFQELEVAVPDASLSVAVQAGPTVTSSSTDTPVSAVEAQTTEPAAGSIDGADSSAEPPEEPDGLLDAGWKRIVLMIAAVNVATGVLMAARGLILRRQNGEWS